MRRFLEQSGRDECRQPGGELLHGSGDQGLRLVRTRFCSSAPVTQAAAAELKQEKAREGPAAEAFVYRGRIDQERPRPARLPTIRRASSQGASYRAATAHPHATIQNGAVV